MVMGASAKAEERIYCASKGYFEEVAHYFGSLRLAYHFVGPEISKELHIKEFYNDSRVEAQFFKGTVGEFLASPQASRLSTDNTLFAGFNPGFGCGYAKLAWSWVQDIYDLLEKEYFVMFTQANDYEDVKGETRILKEALKAHFIQ